MIRREGQRPQTHNLFNEKLALFTEDDARMLNDNISVKSLTPDSSDSSDLDDSDSDDDRDFATKTEKYRHPEFIRENPELAPHAEILASPQILADFKTIKERYPGRSGIFTTDEPVYLVSAEDDDVNELSLLERFALSDPRSDVHHQARDGLMNVLYDLVGFHEPSDEALGALALIRKAYADSGPDEELEEADPKADEPKSNVAALSFSTAVSVMRFLCQSKTDIFPGIISDLLAQPPSGPQKKPDPPHCTSTPPSEALPDGSNAVRARDIGAVQADLREKLAPLEADLRTELMWPTLKTVVELLPLFDLSEWTPDQIAALLFALARIYIDRMAGADLQYAAEKAFELILAKYELGELLMDNGVLTKFLKLFPLIDEALGGLNSLIRTIFRHIPLLKSQRVKALAELVAYLLKQLPPMSDEDRSLIETEREKTSDWKLPQDYFNIYSSLPHIYKQLVEVPNQLYHFVEILCEAIVGTKRALTAFDSGGLDYMWNQQTIAENCLNKTFDHRIIKDSSDRALESVNHVRGIKHRALGWLANGKDDDSDTDSDSD